MTNNQIVEATNLMDNQEAEKLLTVSDVMKMYSVTRPFILKWVEGGCPCMKNGNRYFFKKKHIDEYLDMAMLGREGLSRKVEPIRPAKKDYFA